MIRRSAPGGREFRLIAQDDHAALAGQLAARFGDGDLYARPADRPRLAQAVALHDCGWQIHDDAPTLNDAGLPLDVFESSVELDVRVWEASAAAAEQIDPYAGLLVSVHVQRLAAHATRRGGHSNRETFWLIEFANDQAQRQMALRQRLGLRVDRPLDGGLPLTNGPGHDDPAEQALAYHARILQACDLLSLCACCDAPPTWTAGPLPRKPGGATLPLQIARPSDGRLIVHPWPFDAATVMLDVPYRPVPARQNADAAGLRATLADAPRRTFQVVVEPKRRL